MSTPKPSTSYVKLAIPGNRNGDQRHIDIQEQKLIEYLARININARIDGERIKVSADHEDSYYETTFRIQSENGFDYNILQHAAAFLCSMKQLFQAQTGSLVLNHIALFNQQILCSERDLGTERVYFGNFCHNTFINHFDVWFHPQTKRVLMKPNKSPQNGCRPGNGNNNVELNSIKTTFDFDKAYPVTIEFRTIEPLMRVIKKEGKLSSELQDADAKYTLSIEGDAIRQLVVDPYCRRIYFVLKNAVVAKRVITWLGQPYATENGRSLHLPFNRTATSTKEVLTENKVFSVEFNDLNVTPEKLHTIVSRFRCRWNIPVEVVRMDEIMGNIEILDRYNGLDTIYCTNDFYKDVKIGFTEVLDRWFPQPGRGRNGRNDDFRIYEKKKRRVEERRFAYTYLIQALLSRGAAVKDHLLRDKRRWDLFIRIIGEHLKDDSDESIDFYQRHVLCESALEDLLNYVDGKTRDGDLLVVFKRLCMTRKESGISNELSKEAWDQGYRKVRKVILTPTRMIFLAPEIMMSNRAITGADHDGTRIIRVTFRDDNLQKMRFSSLRELLENSVLHHLEHGFEVMGRCFSYLASSNSQMRDGGAYFMERFSKAEREEYTRKHGREPEPHYKPKILNYRNQLGTFEDTGSIPKAMARLGQCFTQARRCDGVEIGFPDFALIPDVRGGKNENGESYMFTDGVGMISMDLARRLCGSMGLPSVCLPSTYQIRFLGFKGMLTINPGMDEQMQEFRTAYRRGFIEKASNKEDVDLAPFIHQCLFRDSQKKFDGRGLKKEEKWPIEMVKYSTPTAVTLNRPFINILDQVSALQSLSCHRRVCKRIETLLDTELENFSKCIVNEEHCRSRLEGMPRRVHFEALERRFGFRLSTEPFFRTLIRASIDSSMNRLLKKVQIPIPASMGRTMFGVTDETGQLQYGQIFARFTENVNNKHPAKNSGTTLKGKVLVTKFPSMCEGDVRMYEAVDIPELRHLTDVIVFPQNGPRSQPDEMAGSDLDGDEYAVIWDPLLFFERTEKAFAYCSDKRNEVFTLEDMDRRMNEFYVEYMQQEDVGVTSTNHLHQSDQFGITAPVCNELVKKNAMTLDFSKSGKAPAPLQNEGYLDRETGIYHPPERSERRPDYAQSRHAGSASYASSRLLGTLHRELRSINDVVMSSSEKQVPVVIDKLLVWEGWKDHAARAKTQMQKYNGQMRSIMDTFGVATEAEVFSGCFREIRNRQSEKEQDDMSAFSTEAIIEGQMTELYQKFRREFFEEFVESQDGMPPAYMRCTVPENERISDNEKDVLRRVCRNPTDAMMAKAVAYYRTCYENASQNEEKRLSFAWIAYDILNTVRGKKILEMGNVPPTRLPQFQAICDHRKKFIDEDNDQAALKKVPSKLGKFNSSIICVDQLLDKQEIDARKIILGYCLKNPNLQKCLVIIDSWARAKGLLHEIEKLKSIENQKVKDREYHIASTNYLKWYHLALLVIMVATNKLGSLLDEKQGHMGSKIFEVLNPSDNSSARNKLSDADSDRLTLSFFRFLSTREFRCLRALNFKPIGLSSIFMRGEWLPYHVAATQTYYNILLNLRFDELPLASESVTEKQNCDREGEPFLVEVPVEFDKGLFLERLRESSKCTEIQCRIDNRFSKKKNFARVIISSRGTSEAINELRDFTILKLPRQLSDQDSNLSEALAHMLYYKVMGKKLVEKKSDRQHSAPNLQGAPKRRNIQKKQRSGPNFVNRNNNNYF